MTGKTLLLWFLWIFGLILIASGIWENGYHSHAFVFLGITFITTVLIASTLKD